MKKDFLQWEIKFVSVLLKCDEEANYRNTKYYR